MDTVPLHSPEQGDALYQDDPEDDFPRPQGTSSTKHLEPSTYIDMGHPDDHRHHFPTQGQPTAVGPATGLPSYDQASAEQEPPDYHSVLGQIRKEREESRSLSEFVFRVTKYICFAFGFLVVLALVFSLSITFIVIGAKKWDAPCQASLAEYLVVMGVVGVVSNLVSFVKMKTTKKRDPEDDADEPVQPSFANRCVSCTHSLLSLFSTIWLIFGSVWVYNLDPGENFENCDELLYLFTYWTITATYIVMGIAVFLVCCSGCLVVTLSTRDPRT